MPRLPTQADMAGPVSMAPQGKTPHVPSAAPIFDAQMDIGRAVSGVGNAISAEIKIADKEAEKETKEQEALDVNNADVEYRSKADEISRATREGKDDYDKWGATFREGVDKSAAEILDRYPNLSEKTRDRLLSKWDSHDRVYVNRLEGDGAKMREDTRFGQTKDNLLRSMAPALDPNSDMTPEQVDDLMRQSLGNLELARKYLPPKRVDQIENEIIRGSGPNSMIYQYGIREGAREVENGRGIGTGAILKDIDEALPHAGARMGTSRQMQSLDPLTMLQDKGNLASPEPAYNGPMPRIEKLPDGKPFSPVEVPKEINQSRPAFERGRMQLGVSPDAEPIEVPYFTGSKTKENYPGLQYGAFTLLPHRVGEDHRYGDTISINPLGAAKQTPITDPKVGRARNGQLIHPEQGNPTNIGCISVPDDKWPEVKSAVAQMWKEHGKTNVVLVNAPGQTQIMTRAQYDAMYGGKGTDVADAAAPGAEPSKRFLALPGLNGTYGNDKTAFDEIGAKYGAKVDYLDGDPQWGGAGRNGETSPQVKAAVEKLATGEYDGIVGFSAGGYNVRQILQSKEFQALPEAKQAKIQKVIAVGISDEHLKDFKLDDRFQPEVYGNIGGKHLDAPRALAKQLGISPKQASVEGIGATVSPEEFFRGKGVNVAELPLGMRVSNNPGNLKYSGSDWQKSNLYGLVGPSTAKDQGDPQAQFANPLAGMASAVRLAQTKFNHHGLDTVEKIITDKTQGWTPGFKGAADAIAAGMGVKPTDKVDLNDPATMGKFMRALITQEHGESGKLYDDKLISRGVEIAFGGKGAQPTRMADASDRMNLGAPKGDEASGVEPGGSSPAMPGADPMENIDQAAIDAPVQERRDYNSLSARARVLSHLSPESLLKLRTRTQTMLTDSGKVFQDNAVAHAARTGEDWRHPETGQTYGEWAKGTRQPQQVARGERRISEAKMRFNAMADIGQMNQYEFSDRIGSLRNSASPEDLASVDKLERDMLQAYGKVQELAGKDPAQVVSGFSIKKGGVPTFDIDKDGRVTKFREDDGFAKPHPIVSRALDDIRGDDHTGISVVQTPDGNLTINTSKAASPLVRQAAWDKMLSARIAAQGQRGIEPGMQRAITAHEARTFLGKLPGPTDDVDKYWKRKADEMEQMVGPDWAPQVLREMRDFQAKDDTNKYASEGTIGTMARSSRQSMMGLGDGVGASGARARDMARLDGLGRALDGQSPGGLPDPMRPALSQPVTPRTGGTADLPAKLMPNGAIGPGVNAAPLPSEKVRAWVKERLTDPKAQQAIDLKFGPGAFARIVAEQQKKGKGWLPF